MLLNMSFVDESPNGIAFDMFLEEISGFYDLSELNITYLPPQEEAEHPSYIWLLPNVRGVSKGGWAFANCYYAMLLRYFPNTSVTYKTENSYQSATLVALDRAIVYVKEHTAELFEARKLLGSITADFIDSYDKYLAMLNDLEPIRYNVLGYKWKEKQE
jgi:hypothetical protein